MLLSRQAFELIVTPHDPMQCKPPNFPEIVLTLSDCGTYKYYKDEKFFIVVFLETSTRYGMVVIGFYRGNLSNFSKIGVVYNINGKDVVFHCGEQAFKAACAVAHLNPKDDSLNVKNLEVLKAVLNAPEPKKAKSATFKLEGFDSKMWDVASPEVMYWVQLLKFKDPEFRAFMLEIAQIAKDNGIDADHVFFTEASGEEDRVWGTGPGANVDELFGIVCKEGNSIKLYNNLVDPKKRREPADLLFVGFNGLGKAIDMAFRDLSGDKFQGLLETMDEFIARVNAFGGFDFFEYDATLEEPEAKRSRSNDNDDSTTDNVEPKLERELSCKF